MPIFIYKIKTKAGEQTGELEGESKESVIQLLRKQKFQVISVKKKPKSIFTDPPPTTRDVVIFTRQFATMISAGLPLVQCLDILSGATENKAFRKVISDVKYTVEKGETLADGLRKHPKIFDNLFSNMIDAGEVGGILDTILKRLAGYMEKAAKLKGQVKAAMIYPAAIVSIATIVIVFLMIAVIPQFASMFEGSGQALPLPTQIVMTISDLVIAYILYAIPGAVIFFFVLKKYYSTEKGQHNIDFILLKLPVFGLLIQKVAVAKFTRTLGTLLQSGVPIIQAIEITGRTAGNKIIEEAVLGLTVDIKQGRTISDPLAKAKVFPMMVVSMIAVGEEVGALDTMCEKIADFYDEEVDLAVEGLTALLEPMLMAFLGVVVGGIVIAMYLPIFKLASTG